MAESQTTNLQLTVDLPEESTDIPTWHQKYNQNMKIIDANVAVLSNNKIQYNNLPIPKPVSSDNKKVISVDENGNYELGNYVTTTTFNTTIGNINSILDTINGEII